MRVRFIMACWAILAAGSPDFGQTTRPGGLSGRVVDFEGRAVAGAEVTATAYFQRPDATVIGRAATGTDGRFELQDVPGPMPQICVAARKAGLAAGWHTQGWKAPEGPVEIVLERAAEIAGVVVDRAGKPVPGATVLPILESNGHVLADMRDPSSTAVATDVNGRFVLTGIPADAGAALVVRADGYAAGVFGLASSEGREVYRFRPGCRDIRVALEPEGIVTGRVVDKVTGRPLPGVVLSLRSVLSAEADAAYMRPQATTDADGRFRAGGLAEGLWTIQAAEGAFGNPPAVWVRGAVAVRAGQAAEPVKLEASVGAILTAKVKGSDGAGIACRLFLNGDCGHGAILETDADGTGRALLAPGKWWVDFGESGSQFVAAGRERLIVLREGQVQEIRLTGEPYHAFRGRTTDARGQAVGGVEVHYVENDARGLGPEFADYPSGRDGGFALTCRMVFDLDDRAVKQDFAFPITLVARQARQNLFGTLCLKEAPRGPAVVTLAPAICLRGQVTDTAGKAVPFPVVRAWFKTLTPSGGQAGIPVFVVVTGDAGGAYTILGLPAGVTVHLSGAVPGFSGSGPAVDLPAGPGQALAEPIRLKPWRLVTGVVVTGSGSPAAGAFVHNSDNQCPLGETRRAVTDAAGAFRILVPADRFELWARLDSPRLSGSASGGADVANVTIRLKGRPPR